MTNPRNIRRKQRGNALITSVMVFMLLSAATAAYVNTATQNVREAKRQMLDVTTSGLCEAGIQTELQNLWTPFKANQNFTAMDAACAGATIASPTSTTTGTIANVGAFSVGVIAYTTVDSYTRRVKIRSVGYVDSNGNGKLDAKEPSKIVDQVVTYSLARSKVFDYTYFINNYGWMDGFGPNDLVVNGDMRANGNFDFTNGSPTVNGSVYASQNANLSPAPAGLLNTPPVKWDDATYLANQVGQTRWRQGYNSAVMGAKSSAQYTAWQPDIFDSNGSIVNGAVDGAVVADSTGTNGWVRTSTGNAATETLLDNTPTQTVVMPDLNNLAYYQNQSQNYTDPKATFADGTANPLYGVGAYIKTWNSSSNSYQTITTNGVLTGATAIIGTSTHPVLIHGPVTITQDVAVSGTISGQGTVYTGRNVHIVGSILYKNPPNFTGNNSTTIQNANEHDDLVAFAARGSIIMGDTSQFANPYPLSYMTPPFTHGRYDDQGNWIPPFDATARDSTGFMKYQSVLGDSYIHNISSGINQMDAILYSNFCGGGDIGTSGGGVKLNGSIITRDEAMVTWSLPMAMNYDQRIKEKNLANNPMIDINLPRSPSMLRNTWQDRGFFYGG